MSELKKVLIVGGGYAGVSLVTELSKKKISNLKIVLISKNDYFYHNIASPRTIVDDKIISDIVLPFDNLMKGDNKEFIHGKVTQIHKNEVKYSSIVNNVETNEEKKVTFDYLVLALGTKYSQIYYGAQNSMNMQINELRETNEKFKKSTSVLVLGGGPVGIETAGEIETDFPKIKVTLLTNSEKRVPYMTPAFSEKALAVLTQKNVEVIFNDSVELNHVENFKNQKITTKKGKSIEFDAYFMCFGGKPMTDIVKNSFPNWLDENDRIIVNKHFQVPECSNIFAIGDCCNTKEVKLAYIAGQHAAVLAENIYLILDKKIKLKEYSPPSKSMMVMSIGRDNGAFQFASLTFKGFLPTHIKSKHLFISKYKDMLNNNSESTSIYSIIALLSIFAVGISLFVKFYFN